LAIEIQQCEPGKSVADFVRAGFEVFRHDPAWVPPLSVVFKEKLTPSRDPFYEHAEVALFTARRGGRLVGRVSASVDHAWLDYWKDATGHFGYFDTVNDADVAHALLERAERWLRARGITRVSGPMSFSASQEVGLLVDGFDSPPSVDMPHSRRHQAALVEGCGYVKEKDLFAWHYDIQRPFNARTLKAWETITALPEVKLRTVERKHLRQEIATIMAIYNETWAGKWGYVPITAPELDKMAKDLSIVIDPDIAFIADVHGEPAGMCISVPNLNEAIADLNGSLLPMGWAKLLWRVKVAHPVTMRLILLGVRERYRRNVKRYGALSTAMYVECAKRSLAKGYRSAELGWTREDDAPINLGIRSMGGRVYKTYRVYEKMLGPRAAAATGAAGE
jgi:hypothetical protein